MISSEVQRTLVKSPPELWSELSDPDALARHLGELGEIKITRTEPEKLVAWEAQGTTGTVAIKASGWGTKVTLTVHHEPPAPTPAVTEDEESERGDAPEDENPQALSAEAQDDVIVHGEPAATVPSPSADEPTAAAAETVPAESKPAPATEAARRAAGWPEAREPVGPAIESDLRAAEADAPPEHAPWHLEDAQHDSREDVRESSPTAEPAAAEPRRGFFARLFGSRRKRPVAAEEHSELAEPAAELSPASPPTGSEPDAIVVSPHEHASTEDAPEQPGANPASVTLAPVEPEPPVLVETKIDDGPAIDAEAGTTEPETIPDPEPPSVAATESDDLAAELKAAEEIAAEQVKAVLTSVLDRLGAAHHRPFSRA